MDNNVTITLLPEQQENIKQMFIERCKHLGVKYRSKKYYTAQAEFFAGVATASIALGFNVPPMWLVACLSDREIIEDYSHKTIKVKENG